ncbi:MAG: insulinase family protein, partial [Muribaculaceae bacterium]|nr:insulinase family protein [Muribaculaceae bacterium]
VDVDHIEAQIKELFKDCVLDPNAAQVVEEPVPDNEQPIVVVDKDKEQTINLVRLMFKREAFPKEVKSDLVYLLFDYGIEMIGDMLNNRLSEKAQEPDCPYAQGFAYDDDFLYANNVKAFQLIALPKDGQTEAATQALLTEGLRAAQYGFTATEYERAKEEYMSELEKKYNERDNITNEEYGRQYCRHYLENDPIPSIEDKYQIMSMYAPQIPVDFVNQLLPGLITADGENLVVLNFNKEQDGAVYPTPESLLAAVNAAENADIEPYEDNVKQEPLISQLPKAGKIKKEKYNSQFDYKELELSNGARVILKKTDFNNNEIKMQAIARGGSSLYGEKDWATTQLMPAFTMMSGLGNFSFTELQKAMAGKKAQVMMGMDTYTDVFSGESTVKDLETLFQLTYLKFTDIRKDEKNYNMLMNRLETMLKDQDLDPSQAFSDSVDYILDNHSWRSKPFKVEDLQNVDCDRALQIVKERTANAANYTFYFVGNFDETVIRPLIEQYIASLPGKKGKLSNWVNVDTHPVGETVTHFTRKMETPKANARIYWYDTKTPYSLENSIKAEILGQVLNKIYDEKIREEAGAAYSAGAHGLATIHGDTPWIRILAASPVKPEFADEALKIMNEEMANACTNI